MNVDSVIEATVQAFCFAEGTCLLSLGGLKPIEECLVGGPVLSEDENDHSCKFEVRYVEAMVR